MHTSVWSSRFAFFALVASGFSAACGEPAEPKKTIVPPLLPAESEPMPIVPKPSIPTDPKKLDLLSAPMKVESKNEIQPARIIDAETKTFEQLWIARRNGGPGRDTVRVGLFNHSDREIIVEIDGRSVKLPSLYYVSIDRPRTFAWREKEGELQKVSVPADADGVEVIFKK